MSLPVITYTDSLNRVFNLMVDLDTGNTNSQEYGGRIFSAAFHDFSWSKKTYGKRYGERVLGFTKDAKEYTVNLLFGGSYDERKRVLDLFHSAIENDVMNETPGTLRWDDFTIKCFIISSETHPSSSVEGYTENEVNIYCPDPFWVRTTSSEFYIQDLPEVDTSDAKDYPNQYPFNYLGETRRQSTLTNDSLFSSNWELVINGYAADPKIKIGNLEIAMNLVINASEYLTINSRDKTIILTNVFGRKLNRFGYRDVSNYIFEKIPKGLSNVTWNGGYSWTLTLFEERSEPRWIS